jgi:Cu2+-exporting ATPase
MTGFLYRIAVRPNSGRGQPASAPDGADCFHCGLPMPGRARLWVQFGGLDRPVCCLGCQALFDMVVANGMGEYYSERERRVHRA